MSADTHNMATCPRTHILSHTKRGHIDSHTIKPPTAGVQPVGHNSITILLNRKKHRIVHPLTRSRLSSALHFLYAKTPKNYREDRHLRMCQLNEPASDPSKRGGNAGHGRSISSDRQQHQRSTAVIAAADWTNTAKSNK